MRAFNIEKDFIDSGYKGFFQKRSEEPYYSGFGRGEPSTVPGTQKRAINMPLSYTKSAKE